MLTITHMDERCVAQLRRVWRKMYLAMQGYHQCVGPETVPGWTNWQPDKWAEDKKATDRTSFAAWADSTLVGILNLRLRYDSAIEIGKLVAYIEHIATAPGNISTDIWARRLKGIGSALMAFAILQSIDNGLEGRIGLHASDHTAAQFYNTLSKQHGLFLTPKTGVCGTPENKKALQLLYYETEPAFARAFLEMYRND